MYMIVILIFFFFFFFGIDRVQINEKNGYIQRVIGRSVYEIWII